jgi:hypothetical protein
MIHIGERWCILHIEPLGSFKNVTQVISARNMKFSSFMFRIVLHMFPFGPGNGFQYHTFIFYVCFNLALFNHAFKYFSLYNIVDNELEILYKDPVITLFELVSCKFP